MKTSSVVKNKFQKYRIALALLLSVSANADIPIYQIADQHGKMIFSDTPTQDATRVRLKPVNQYGPVSVQQEITASEKNENEFEQKRYGTFLLASPVDQETFQNQRSILAAVKMDGVLQSGDSISWWLDGKRHSQGTTTQVMIDELERGEHTLQAKLLDAKKHVLMTTQAITFYVHLSVSDAVAP